MLSISRYRTSQGMKQTMLLLWWLYLKFNGTDEINIFTKLGSEKTSSIYRNGIIIKLSYTLFGTTVTDAASSTISSHIVHKRSISFNMSNAVLETIGTRTIFSYIGQRTAQTNLSYGWNYNNNLFSNFSYFSNN